MSDHPHDEAIQLLYGASEEHPAAAVVLDRQGPRLNVSTGHTDNPVEAQLTMLAGYVNWLAEHTDVEPGQVLGDVEAIVEEMRDDEHTLTLEWGPDGVTGE